MIWGSKEVLNEGEELQVNELPDGDFKEMERIMAKNYWSSEPPTWKVNKV